jgi:adenosylcobinamide-phosphate guanylyltransferase
MKLPALIMAGGKGTRLDGNTEKPLLVLEGLFLIDYTLAAASGCERIDEFWAVTSPHTPKTEEHLKEKSIQILRAPGDGYVEDLVFAIKKLGIGKTLTITADLPLVGSADLDWVIDEYQRQYNPALAVMVTPEVAKKTGTHADTLIDGLIPTGVNIVDGKNLNGSEFNLITTKPQFGLNVNTKEELVEAQRRMRNAN